MQRALILALLLPLGAPSAPGELNADPPRCRCAQVVLERYFAQAEIVMIGRAVSVRTVAADAAGAERLEVTFLPQFNQARPFKGSLEGVILATSTSTAGCGVPVQPGHDYVIFASRVDPGNSRLAWFDSCGGSREYPGVTEPGSELFLGLHPRAVVPRLFELGGVAPPQAPVSEFHTSPACWSEPRIYHQGTLPPPLQQPIRITRESRPFPDSEPAVSPNRGYRAWSMPLPGRATQEGEAVVLVDVERATLVRIAVPAVASAPTVQWVSEKLLFFRVAHGRVQFTDVLVDVEVAQVVYTEAARYGDAAFQQYQEACLGQCPCLAVPGSADSLPEPPQHRERPGELPMLQRLTPDNLAFLDSDWDGRIFTEAGGRRFTISALHGATERIEHPIRLHQVEFVTGAWWVRVSLYAEEPCNNPDAVVVHAGWVPAFSRAGFLVAGASPGGC